MRLRRAWQTWAAVAGLAASSVAGVPATAAAKPKVTIPATVQPGVAFSVSTSGWRKSDRVRLYVGEWRTDNIGSFGKRKVSKGRATFTVTLNPQLDVTRDWVVYGCSAKNCNGGRRSKVRHLKVVPASSPAVARGGVVDPETGAVGPLTIDQSTPAEVIAAIGAPERTTPLTYGTGGTSYGYGCSPSCATEYTVSKATGQLTDFHTAEAAYRTPAGTSPGTAAASAVALEGKPFVASCLDGITLPGARASLYVSKQGQKVDGLWLASNTNSVVSC